MNFPRLHFSKKAWTTFEVSSNTILATLTISSMRTSKYPLKSKAVHGDVSKTQVFLKRSKNRLLHALYSINNALQHSIL